jgi:hypothetical protein
MILGILVMLTALSISAVAIYYSVSGLVAIFAAAAVPIIIMGGALEIGKLVTAVWLHRYWNKARWWLKYYLAIAVVVLMFITSMGIFGFLSKAHIEQTAAAEEGIAQIAIIEQDLVRQQSIISRAEQRIVEAEASVGTGNAAIQEQIDKEQVRIDTAYERIEPAIEEQNKIIQTQLDSLEDRVAVYEEEIQALDNELKRLNSLVNDFRAELDGTSVASIEEQIKPYNEQIAQLDADLERINIQANEYEKRISELEIDTSAIEALKTRISTVEETIVVTTNKLQSRERDKIREGQAVIGVTSDGLFGSNTRRALEAWVTAQQDRIAQLQEQETQLRTQAQNTLNTERQRLTDQVKDLRGTQTDNVLQRKQSLLNAIDQIRSNSIEEAKVAKADIQVKIDTVLNTDIPANRVARQTAQDAITSLRQADDTRINAARQTIKDLRASADAQIAASNELIQRLRDNLTVGKDPQVEAVVAEQQQKIIDANNSIDNLTQEKYTLQAEYRKLEAEVGPVKYLAEFIYGETDQDILEEAVRWVIITIIFVFDPLAVLLLIASQATFEMRRRERLRLGSEEQINDNESNDNQHVEHAQSGSADTGSTKSDSTGRDSTRTKETSTDAQVRSDIGTADGGGGIATGVLESREQGDVDVGNVDNDTTSTTSNDGQDVGHQLDTTVQENNVEHDEPSGETIDDSSVQQRETVEEVEGSISYNPEQKARYVEVEEKEKDPILTEAKRQWKEENPNRIIKKEKLDYIFGRINKLPWETGYSQNEEQTQDTLWNKIKPNDEN